MHHLALPADFLDVSRIGLQGFDDETEWDDVNLLTHGNRQSIQYGQRQWQTDGNGTCLSRAGRYFDTAADAFDVSS